MYLPRTSVLLAQFIKTRQPRATDGRTDGRTDWEVKYYEAVHCPKLITGNEDVMGVRLIWTRTGCDGGSLFGFAVFTLWCK